MILRERGGLPPCPFSDSLQGSQEAENTFGICRIGAGDSLLSTICRISETFNYQLSMKPASVIFLLSFLSSQLPIFHLYPRLPEVKKD